MGFTQVEAPMEFKYGMVRVGKHLLIDQTEVTVSDWLGYIVSSIDQDPFRVNKKRRKMTEEDLNYLKSFTYPAKLLPEEEILKNLVWRDVIKGAAIMSYSEWMVKSMRLNSL